MQLFAIALLAADVPSPDLRAALRYAARSFPQLDPGTLALEASRSGRVQCARISHAPAVAAPRRYAESGEDALVLFDGLPLERHGAFAAHDAGVLAERWAQLPGVLEGAFSAVRVDRASDRVECLVDTLGLAPVFVHRSAGGTVLANSVEALRHACGLHDGDVLGLASLLALGWPAGDRTPLRGVEVLRGGLHRFTLSGATSAPQDAAATIARAARDRPQLPVGQMLATTRAALGVGAPVASALTAGRDTRVLLALTRAAGADGEIGFYTSGPPDILDVRVARRMAERFGLQHRLLQPAVPSDPDEWERQTTSFVRRTDGLSPIDAISDHLDHDGDPQRLGVELWGIAGEIGRTVKWIWPSLAAVAPLARDSPELQRRVIHHAVHDSAGLLRPDAVAEVRGWLDGFVAARTREGWASEDLFGTFYAFARVRHWSARGIRRAAATTDLYPPFATQAYAEHCLGLSPGARFVEQPHRRLIDAYAPEVDVDPYEFPWRPQRPERALELVLAEGGRRLGNRVWARLRSRSTSGAPPSLGPRWFEAGLERHRDVALSSPGSAIWDVVDRARYEQLLAGTPEERAPHAVSLGRTLAALWYLDGPEAGGSGSARGQ
jgi:hypothetical protein